MKDPDYTDLKWKRELSNDYGNSMLYADRVLSQVINRLRETGKLASTLYVSDHGECLYDGDSHLAFHGHNTQYEFHIPALVWYSDLYRATYPEKVRQLREHQKSRLSTENVFHTLLDMSDLRYSTEQLDFSFLSARLKRHKRYVDSYGWSDYTNSTFKGDSREVIDRGTPLVQVRS